MVFIKSIRPNLRFVNMFYGFTLCLNTFKLQPKLMKRCMSSISKSEIKKAKNELFDQELKNQRAAVGRVKKIDVKFDSYEDEIYLVMNKDLSTPYDCAKHMTEGVTKTSAIALVNGEPWDMHRPLTGDCNLKLLTMRTPEVPAVNNAFWRTCSLMLGAVADSVFKEDLTVHLHSFPAPNIKSGSFIYDVYIELPNWKPTISELKALSADFVRLANKEHFIQRLETTPELAQEIFKDNPFKLEQIPSIAHNNNGKVILYRLGAHIDISKGPMVGNTGLIGKSTITAVHKLKTDDVENLYRFQGVAIPKGILLNHFAFSILENQAKKLNESIWIPRKVSESSDDEAMIVAAN
ncbi:large ribosomal subunit protein mL39 [Prorops nasuta]|uniref:large ribosomal subunit protein mL39 n=1 Tax=Prorops nasuta TaxID=863751 RepID=UPI0034CD3BC9